MTIVQVLASGQSRKLNLWMDLMGVFWNGFCAGTIAVFLPSLVTFALLLRDAPEIEDDRFRSGEPIA